MPKSYLSKVISFVNIKGGSGKTTLATSTAADLMQRGFKVLLVDTDPTGTTSAEAWYNKRVENNLPEIDFTSITGKGVLTGLDALQSKYDFVVVDSGGSETDEMKDAIVVSDLVVLVCDSNVYSIETLNAMDAITMAAQKLRNFEIKTFGILNKKPTDPRYEYWKQVLDALDGSPFFQPAPLHIWYRGCWEETASYGAGITELDNKKANSQMSEFMNLVAEHLGVELTVGEVA